MNMNRSSLKLMTRRALQGNYLILIAASIICGGISYVVNLLFQIPLTILTSMMGSASAIWSGSADFSDIMEFFSGGSIALLIGFILLMIVFYLVTFSVTSLFSAGFIRMYLNICSTGTTTMSDFFWGFTHKPWKFVLLFWLIGFATFILMVPEIILIAAGIYTESFAFVLVFLIVYNLILIAVAAYFSLTFGYSFHVLTEDPEKGIFQALMESRELMIGNRMEYFILQLSLIGMVILGMISYVGMMWVSPYMGCVNTMFYLSLRSRQASAAPEPYPQY